MDLSHLDALLASSKRLDKEMQELVTMVSMPPATPAPSLQTSFLNGADRRVDSLARAVEAMELKELGPIPVSAEVLKDAATAALLQIERQCARAVAVLEQYGYEPEEPRIPAPMHGLDLNSDDGDIESLPGSMPPSRSTTPTYGLDHKEPQPPPSPDVPVSFAVPTMKMYIPPTTPSLPPTAAGEEPPDSPLASLEDFGISSLSLGLLEGGQGDHKASSAKFAFNDSPLVPVAKTRREEGTPGTKPVCTLIPSDDSPIVPTMKARQPYLQAAGSGASPPHCMFSGLLSKVSERDYAGLPADIRANLSADAMNELVEEINEVLRDKRFNNDPSPDGITIDELCKGALIDPSKANSVLEALIQLRKVLPPSSNGWYKMA
ncbi:hypothetical protein HKX48_004829 [Thoreauomyces humboldtii]|nr:hypothetical protein HKX48_004829 [Thoreauomyces humboldtii]